MKNKLFKCGKWKTCKHKCHWKHKPHTHDKTQYADYISCDKTDEDITCVEVKK